MILVTLMRGTAGRHGRKCCRFFEATLPTSRFLNSLALSSVLQTCVPKMVPNKIEYLIHDGSTSKSILTNIEAAHGRIMDTDIALESTRFARHNVLVQASAAMTAQANQLTNVALQLLG